MIFLSSSESGRAGLGEEGWFLRGMGMTSAVRSRAHRLTTPQNMASSFTNGKRPGVRLKQKKRPQEARPEAARSGERGDQYPAGSVLAPGGPSGCDLKNTFVGKKRPQEGSPPEAVRIRFARTIVPSPNERHSELRMKGLPSS